MMRVLSFILVFRSLPWSTIGLSCILFMTPMSWAARSLSPVERTIFWATVNLSFQGKVILKGPRAMNALMNETFGHGVLSVEALDHLTSADVPLDIKMALLNAASRSPIAQTTDARAVLHMENLELLVEMLSEHHDRPISVGMPRPQELVQNAQLSRQLSSTASMVFPAFLSGEEMAVLGYQLLITFPQNPEHGLQFIVQARQKRPDSVVMGMLLALGNSQRVFNATETVAAGRSGSTRNREWQKYAEAEFHRVVMEAHQQGRSDMYPWTLYELMATANTLPVDLAIKRWVLALPYIPQASGHLSYWRRLTGHLRAFCERSFLTRSPVPR